LIDRPPKTPEDSIELIWPSTKRRTYRRRNGEMGEGGEIREHQAGLTRSLRRHDLDQLAAAGIDFLASSRPPGQRNFCSSQRGAAVQMTSRMSHRLLHSLPAAWHAEMASIAATPVTTGMSGAEVYRLRTNPLSFLKFAEADAAQGLRQEIVRTQWLAHHGIQVATIRRTHDDGDTVSMLTQALPGRPADRVDLPKARLLPALGRALAKLHALPVADCPFDESLAVRLERARQAVDQNAVDARHFDARNRTVSPRDLLSRVAADPPPEDWVVAHGDASLNNMIVGPDCEIGFVDCGHAGRADRYLDLGIVAAGIAADFGRRWVKVFAEAYGEPSLDKRKTAYYEDLYEFF
jgi:aminoglycoside 3'-phosphotransferase II